MSESVRLERAAKAQQLMANPLWTEAFDLVAKGITEKWVVTPIRDRDGAHELKLMMKLLADVRTALEQAVNDGKIVQFNQKQRVMDKVRGVLGG